MQEKSDALATLRQIESLAGDDLNDAEMEREAAHILQRAADFALQHGDVKTAIQHLEAIRQALADTLAHQPAHGRLLLALTHTLPIASSR